MANEQIASLMQKYALMYVSAMYGKKKIPDAMEVLKENSK